MSKKWILPLLGLLALSAILWYALGGEKGESEDVQIKTRSTQGDFYLTVLATGELQAKRSVKIRGPQGMQSAGIWQTTISDLIPEGTLVKAGDYVAALDRTEVANKMRDISTEIEKIRTQLEQAEIDTAIELSGLRDQLANMQFLMKEKNLEVEQSKYEPQMVIRRAELDLDRTRRDYRQLEAKYELEQRQAVAKMGEILATLRQNEFKLGQLQQLSDDFDIHAPEDGMLIYSRTWDGKKQPGSRVTSWDPTVAELPDLTDMITKTYVNEVDISRVKPGQSVSVMVDAFPDRSYTGEVITVANIGEQRPNFDAKVFEVIIQLFDSDSILRPAMTTSVEIQTDTFKQVISIPLEALQADSLPYVFAEQDGRTVRKEVLTGLANADHIIIRHGLAADEEIWLSLPPGDPEAMPFVAIDPAIKAELRRQAEEEERRRKAEQERRKAKVDPEELKKLVNQSAGGDVIIIMD